MFVLCLVLLVLCCAMFAFVQTISTWCPYCIVCNILLYHLFKIYIYLFPDSLEDGWDMTQLKEEEFEEFCVYIVHDRACEKVCRNRAQASLPRNLTLKPSLTQPDNVSVATDILCDFKPFPSNPLPMFQNYLFLSI